MSRLQYFAWAALRLPFADTSCPACAGASQLVARKRVVTALYECASCGLRFRVPKELPHHAHAFYQDAYSAGMPSHAPPDGTDLESYLAEVVPGTEADYARYISVLDAAGVRRGSRVIDYGAAWGYGVWQLRRAGYDASGYELSHARTRFARERVGVPMIDEPSSAPGGLDAVLAAHVMEHLPDPNALWQFAGDVLSTNGVLVAFAPNGDPQTARPNYDASWGEAHPLAITRRHLHAMAERHGFDACVTSTDDRYDTTVFQDRHDGNLAGMEICVVAWKR